MSLADHLLPDTVLIAPRVSDKWELLDRMVETLVAAGHLPAERLEEAKRAILDRERSVSTGMEDGVAVPHAALEGLPGVLAALALLPDGIEFQAMDGQPTRIVVMLLVPREEKLLHVRTLTQVARQLSDESFRVALLRAPDGAAAVELWK